MHEPTSAELFSAEQRILSLASRRDTEIRKALAEYRKLVVAYTVIELADALRSARPRFGP